MRPDIDQEELLAAVEPGFDVVNADLPDAVFGIFNNLQKPGGMLVSHKIQRTASGDAILSKTILSK